MSIRNQLSKLTSNIFGKPGGASFGDPQSGLSKTENIGLTTTPTSSLDGDPLRFGTYQFPKDVFDNQQLGHYMVFYVNQQDRQRYNYRDNSSKQQDLSNKHPSQYLSDTGLRSDRNRLQIRNNQVTGANYDSQRDDLSATSYDRNSSAMQQLGKTNKTTTRISDSIALYLPAQVTDNTSALYEELSMGIGGKAINDVGAAVKSFVNDVAAGKIYSKRQGFWGYIDLVLRLFHEFYPASIGVVVLLVAILLFFCVQCKRCLCDWEDEDDHYD